MATGEPVVDNNRQQGCSHKIGSGSHEHSHWLSVDGHMQGVGSSGIVSEVSVISVALFVLCMRTGPSKEHMMVPALHFNNLLCTA
mmetsp:Transcript_143799/g.251017  ORF Transcript_143799/g.251017 Transcript_143799/m.251017 type:complete len:85 (+) Transcript_143799:2385-2639(+)